MGKPYVRLDKDNAAVLLVDHQTGLLSLVRDIDPDKFKNNVLALAAAAKYFNLPTILTTSFEQGPNGPLVPELKEMFPDAPYIARPGQIIGPLALGDVHGQADHAFLARVLAAQQRQGHQHRQRAAILAA